MSLYLNSVTIIGNLTRDPELKSLPSGSKVANFSIATNRVWYNSDKQKQEDVEYHNIVVFGKQAENVSQYMSKGSQILVEGRLQTRSWDDTATGKKMYRTEIIAENVQFGSRNDSQKHQAKEALRSHAEAQGMTDIEYPEEEINPEDIPF